MPQAKDNGKQNIKVIRGFKIHICGFWNGVVLRRGTTL